MDSSLLNILECPVCLCIPTSTPVFQCHSNGHVICKVCVVSLGKMCPICRQEAGFTRCLTAEKLLLEYQKASSLAKVDANQKTGQARCKFQRFGCTYLASNPVHEAKCSRRPVHCPDVTCHKTIPVVKVVKSHLPAEHPDIRLHLGSKKLFRLSVRGEHWSVATSYKPVRFVEFGHSFFREARRDDVRKSWFFWVYFDGTPDEAKAIQAEISFLSESLNLILTFVDNVVPLDVGLQEVMDNHYGLVLSDDFMRHKIVKKEEFYLSITLKKTPIK